MQGSCQGLGGGERGELFNAYRVSVLQDAKKWEMVVMVAQHQCT